MELMEQIFDDWYRSHAFPLLAVRYENMWDNLDIISKFLDLDLSDFPPYKPRISRWRGQVPDMYKRFINKIHTAEDIKKWKTI
jgi:hypothetical protein